MSALDDAKFVQERLVDVFYDSYCESLDEMRTMLLNWMNIHVKRLSDLDEKKAEMDEFFSLMRKFALENYEKGISMDCCTENQKEKFKDKYDEYLYLKEEIVAEIFEE